MSAAESCDCAADDVLTSLIRYEVGRYVPQPERRVGRPQPSRRHAITRHQPYDAWRDRNLGRARRLRCDLDLGRCDLAVRDRAHGAGRGARDGGGAADLVTISLGAERGEWSRSADAQDGARDGRWRRGGGGGEEDDYGPNDEDEEADEVAAMQAALVASSASADSISPSWLWICIPRM